MKNIRCLDTKEYFLVRNDLYVFKSYLDIFLGYFSKQKRPAASTLVKAIEIAFKYSHGTLDFCQPNGGDLIDSSLYVAKSAEPDTAVHG